MPNIRLDGVQLTNFLSYKDCTINFKSGIYPIIGSIDGNSMRSNGAGKTAIAEAIYWCLYGKPLRKISVDELVNSSEGKNCRVLVRLTDTETDRIGIISRYRKDDNSGNSVAIEICDTNGERYVYKTQESINDFIGMDDVMFANSVMFGRSDKLILFSKMSDGEKKDFIRKICPQLKKLEDQNTKYSDKLAEIKKLGASLDAKKLSIEGKLAVRRDMIARLDVTLVGHKVALERAKSMNASGSTKELEADLNEVRSKIKKLEKYVDSSKYKNLIETGNKYEQDINELQSSIIRLNADLSSRRANIKQSMAGIKCPTCNRPFDNAEELKQFGNKVFTEPLRAFIDHEAFNEKKIVYLPFGK